MLCAGKNVGQGQFTRLAVVRDVHQKRETVENKAKKLDLRQEQDIRFVQTPFRVLLTCWMDASSDSTKAQKPRKQCEMLASNWWSLGFRA